MKTLIFVLFLLLCVFAINANQQEEINHEHTPQPHQKLLYKVQQWRTSLKESSSDAELKLSSAIIVAGVLCFIASLISSAGGIGDGVLFIPIMTMVAGLDLKTASSFSAFMVTGGSLANVINSLFSGQPYFDYDLALLLEPCMLLGVSIGVICNRVFPEWLSTALFVAFLLWSCVQTCGNGEHLWKIESDISRRGKGNERPEEGLGETEEENQSLQAPLLEGQENRNKTKLPWKKLSVLVIVWGSFIVIHLLRVTRIISVKPCSVEYWFLLSLQIPLALLFTKLALSRTETLQELSPRNQENQGGTRLDKSTRLMFPVMSFLAGILGGIFGIGGGVLISPLLLQAGIAPQIAASTTSSMVYFSATMSTAQYLLLGMQNTQAACLFSLICFFASLLGVVLFQKAVAQFGRASIIMFLVGTVMFLSTDLMASFGILEFYINHKAGKDMGFQLLC